MSQDRESNRAHRAALRREHGALYDRVLGLLFARDPIGINLGNNTEEYEPEVDTILPRLAGCGSAEDVQRVIHEELCRRFSPERAGPLERYADLGEDVWAEIQGRATLF